MLSWPNKLDKKIKTTVQKTYQVKEYSLEAVDIDAASEEGTVLDFQDKLYRVGGSDAVLGYIYVSQAASMKNVFDYIILFDSALQIVNTKVLIYREDHGRQIGTKRWLKQFFGMTLADRPELGSTVDGISGATISCTNMTEAVNKVLTGMNYLQEHGQI